MYFNNNPYNPYQNFYQPQQQNIQAQNWQMVDSVEAVKSKDIDMSGNPRYYPNINGTEIYVKQLQSDGTCSIITYKKEQDAPQENKMLQQILEQICQINSYFNGGGDKE